MSNVPGQPLRDDEMDRMAVLLHELLMEPTFHRKQRLVEGNPLLLRTEADSALAGLILEYAGDDHVSESLLLHR